MRLFAPLLLALAACPSADDTGGPGDSAGDPGALVAVAMDGTVGVLLDEIPEDHRDRAATLYLAEGSDFWTARATMQVETTLYRLVYRNFYYDEAGQLPLPPKEQWTFTLGTPERRTVDGHDLVVVDYAFGSTLLTGADEPGIAEPLLAETGGVWEEPFVLPVDPDLLLERTGYACTNESDFPPNSVDTENARAFFDDTCEGGSDPEGCHLTEPIPDASCVDAMTASVGTVTTGVRFERLAWDDALAGEVRLGEQQAGGAQLRAMPEGLADYRIVYRYFPADSCAITEGCVGGPGWRRLLQFTASMQNLGAEDAAIGDVGEGSGPVENDMVAYSECHEHMHFNHYGDFSFGDGDEELGSKRAFCLESTSRYFNNEDTPLTHPYACDYQGTAAGWGDDYIAGLDCQWIDVTTVDATGGLTAPLTFHVNPDGFLCEGAAVTDESGELVYEETEFVNEHGETESRIACEPFEGWDADNVATVDVTLAEDGGLITSACTRGQLGERRNCGFTEQTDDATCTPGESVTLRCAVDDASVPQALRVCESSAVLGTGVACTWRDALASATVAGATDVTFTCPAARDASEPGGVYALYGAPLVPGDVVQTVSCSAR